ncbi:hypothetical protein PHAVU_011G102800 [Phaseolus vulgaris]|uniref:Uncharacterized protein n=1 Tax=Phaseolus vulgaris TaxID=3885 RepID=V7AGY6_PHAVU|nr:hypothetical protein PHAVU_011G102800g [Phaseolus vulgaris]ESW04530.1 hypothetical protein PHAVU_011G102800g [Phaseolus vulgaris]
MSHKGENIELYVSTKLLPREDFTAYADVCFREFGDRVKHTTTVKMAMQQGIIGLNIISFGYLPKTNSTDDVRAAQRA